MARFIAKNITCPGFSNPSKVESVFLDDAQRWVSRQEVPADYQIWEFVGANPALKSHYIRVAS